MSIANTDQRVLGYLGRGLSLELSAVQLYSTQAKLVDNWGLAEVAGKLSAEASEELGHAERIIGRMLALGVAPNASQLRPVRLGADLRTLLEHDYAFEEELVALYSEASNHCARIGDQDNRLFFEELLSEEQAHAETLRDWLQQLQ
ncbi:MAG: bacterioferritin [Gammaproteobacteria bacterium]|nr:bacterioferritin [Gammaproteobacteria bacterium]